MAEMIGVALLGGAAGLFLVVAFDPTGRQISDMESFFSIVIGACAAVAVNRALRG
jgi:hypothetical protein